jgi:hypothetical protein
MDRESFIDAWGNTGDDQVIADTTSEIARFRTLKGKTFKESVSADREGVRLALLAAECWYSGSESAQVGREKRHAAAMYKRVHQLRSKLFGSTLIEVTLKNAVSIPTHKVSEMIKSGLTPTEFLASLNNR